MSKAPTFFTHAQFNAALAAERVRIRTILESPAGLRNPWVARKLAVVDCLPADTALDVLAGIPAENPYLAALEKEAPPVIGAPTTGAATEDYRTRRMAEIKASADAVNARRGYR